MKKLIKILYVCLISICFLNLDIVLGSTDRNQEVIQSFKNILEISKIEILTPTVVEVSIPNQIFKKHFAVYNTTKDRFEPYELVAGSDTNKFFPANIKIDLITSNFNLFDYDYNSFSQFVLNENSEGNIEIEYNFNEPVKSDSLNLSLDRNVSLPNFITIKAIVDGNETIIASRIKPVSSVINFPVTVSKKWTIEIEYSQLLRINEMQFNNLGQKAVSTNLRFLAQPKNDYRIYFEPEVVINQITGEKPNLNISSEIKKVTEFEIKSNPEYKLADSDNDKIPDINDNCVSISNFDQLDVNQNQRGDVCDDFDKDGVVNSEDNCVNDPNSNQADIDIDDVGDICDESESRITEKYPWLVWAGLSFAGFIFLGLFAVALRRVRFEKKDSNDLDLSDKK